MSAPVPFDLTVLMYHYVRDMGDACEVGSGIGGWPTAAFEAQLEAVKRAYHPVSWAEVQAHLAGAAPLPPRALPAGDAQRIAAAAERLRTKLPVALRGRLAEWLTGVDAAQLDAATYRAACIRAADRAGLLACGDITAVAAAAPHLVKLAASRRYLDVRRRLRRA